MKQTKKLVALLALLTITVPSALGAMAVQRDNFGSAYGGLESDPPALIPEGLGDLQPEDYLATVLATFSTVEVGNFSAIYSDGAGHLMTFEVATDGAFTALIENLDTGRKQTVTLPALPNATSPDFQLIATPLTLVIDRAGDNINDPEHVDYFNADKIRDVTVQVQGLMPSLKDLPTATKWDVTGGLLAAEWKPYIDTHPTVAKDLESLTRFSIVDPSGVVEIVSNASHAYTISQNLEYTTSADISDQLINVGDISSSFTGAIEKLQTGDEAVGTVSVVDFSDSLVEDGYSLRVINTLEGTNPRTVLDTLNMELVLVDGGAGSVLLVGKEYLTSDAFDFTDADILTLVDQDVSNIHVISLHELLVVDESEATVVKTQIEERVSRLKVDIKNTNIGGLITAVQPLGVMDDVTIGVDKDVSPCGGDPIGFCIDAPKILHTNIAAPEIEGLLEQCFLRDSSATPFINEKTCQSQGSLSVMTLDKNFLQESARIDADTPSVAQDISYLVQSPQVEPKYRLADVDIPADYKPHYRLEQLVDIYEDQEINFPPEKLYFPVLPNFPELQLPYIDVTTPCSACSIDTPDLDLAGMLWEYADQGAIAVQKASVIVVEGAVMPTSIVIENTTGDFAAIVSEHYVNTQSFGRNSDLTIKTVTAKTNVLPSVAISDVQIVMEFEDSMGLGKSQVVVTTNSNGYARVEAPANAQGDLEFTHSDYQKTHAIILTASPGESTGYQQDMHRKEDGSILGTVQNVGNFGLLIYAALAAVVIYAGYELLQKPREKNTRHSGTSRNRRGRRK